MLPAPSVYGDGEYPGNADVCGLKARADAHARAAPCRPTGNRARAGGARHVGARAYAPSARARAHVHAAR
ncbi:hypothetical protein, partial [Staphylococcus epidermidis]|uniref:hypothetical protein n=1 Tax=Staphylococcus epidermidis TaxID=1282 RepID=UPI0027382526